MRRRAGFTLVEVLLAMIVAVAVFTIVAQGLSLAARSETRSVRTARALELASAKMAEIESGTLGTTRALDGDFGEADAEFAWEVSTAATGHPGVSAVRVVVRWIPFGPADQVALVRYVQ